MVCSQPVTPQPNQGSTVPDFGPFLLTGLAFGAVYAVSGVGIVMLYRTTGVLHLAFGAIGAVGALTAFSLSDSHGVPISLALIAGVVVAALITLAYGTVVSPRLADRDPMIKLAGTLGLTLTLLGVMFWVWDDRTRRFRLPGSDFRVELFGGKANGPQLFAIVFAVVVSVGITQFLRRSKLGTAMRAIANDRAISSMLGVPVQRIEAAAWLASGVICGVVGLLMSSLLRLDLITLTFFVISALAAALIGQLSSLGWTFGAGMAIGLIESELTAIQAMQDYRKLTPFVLAIAALLWIGRHRTVNVGGRIAG
jgi:branched-chain amino acid transport system permease protein